MENDTSILLGIIKQDYPLQISHDAAEAFITCLRRIMDAVPEDDRVFVRAEYELVTTALHHPEGDSPRTNERLRRPEPNG